MKRQAAFKLCPYGFEVRTESSNTCKVSRGKWSIVIDSYILERIAYQGTEIVSAIEDKEKEGSILLLLFEDWRRTCGV